MSGSKYIAAVPGQDWLVTYHEGSGLTWTEPVVAWVIDDEGFGWALVTDEHGDLQRIEPGRKFLLWHPTNSNPMASNEVDAAKLAQVVD